MFKIKHTVLSTLSALALGLAVTSINAAGAGMGGMGSSTGSGSMGSNAGSGSMGDMSAMDGKGSMTISTDTPAVK